MRYVVAGVMLVAAMIIAGISLLIPLEGAVAGKNNSGAALMGDKQLPAAAVKTYLASLSWAHRGMILISSLLCAVVGWISVGLNPVLWGYGKWCAAALMLLAAMIVD